MGFRQSVTPGCSHCGKLRSIELPMKENLRHLWHCALRKLKQLSVQPHLLLLLYRSIIEPVLMYGAISFFHMLTVVNRNKLLKIPNLASKIIGIPTPKLSDCVTSATIRKAHIILNDPDHPLHRYFILLPSGHRYRLPMCKRTNFSKSFVPTEIRALNT